MFACSLPNLTGAISAFFSGTITSSIGRRKFLMICNGIIMISSLFTIIGYSETLILGRVLIGFATGGLASVGSLYAIEIAPIEYKSLVGSC